MGKLSRRKNQSAVGVAGWFNIRQMARCLQLHQVACAVPSVWQLLPHWPISGQQELLSAVYESVNITSTPLQTLCPTSSWQKTIWMLLCAANNCLISFWQYLITSS